MHQLEMKIAKRMLTLLDLTDLSKEIELNSLCQRAVGPYESVAAICVREENVEIVKGWLAPTEFDVKVAAVANFPKGDLNVYRTVSEVKRLIALGADELDVVFPYHALLNRQAGLCLEFVEEIRRVTEGRTLKMILETGALGSFKWIRKAAEISVRGNVDFIKTSTGRYKYGATIDAVKVLFKVIRELDDGNTGIKVSGGINTFKDATQYLELAIEEMGQAWVHAENFRFGSSRLYNALIDVITHESDLNN